MSKLLSVARVALDLFEHERRKVIIPSELVHRIRGAFWTFTGVTGRGRWDDRLLFNS
jgi:hypothetical protein